MFSNALKSFTSNILSNYTISPTPTSFAGPWKIYDAKKKSTGKAASVFVFDKKSLEPPAGAGFGGRSAASGLKRAHEEVVERLKKEASSLARLRHPSVLELVEPVEDTRGGGLQFATEPVTASLAGLLQEKDEQEKAGGVGGRRSRYVIEEADGQKRRRELEIDELEIQKGLLQIAKGLEFLHESAGLVHANLTPDAIFINAKVCNVIPAYTPHSLMNVTVRLEDLRARFLDTARKLHETFFSDTDFPLRSSQLRRTTATARSTQCRLYFARFRYGWQCHTGSRHVQSRYAHHRFVQLAAHQSDGIQRECVFVQTCLCVFFVRTEQEQQFHVFAASS